MSSKHRALALALLAVAPFASASPTIDELSSLAAEAKAAELRSRIKDATAKSEPPPPGISSVPAPRGPVAAAISESNSEDDIRLMAVYGLSKRLRAEISYNGRMVIVSPGVNEQVGPWELKEISPYRVTLVKAGASAKESKRDVYMSGQHRVELHARPVGNDLPQGASSIPMFPMPPAVPVTPQSMNSRGR